MEIRTRNGTLHNLVQEPVATLHFKIRYKDDGLVIEIGLVCQYCDALEIGKHMANLHGEAWLI